MAAPVVRPEQGHGPGGGRLKPIKMDLLESYGLPSKGDNRLASLNTQEIYFREIVDRYTKIGGISNEVGCDMESRLAALSISRRDEFKARISELRKTGADMELQRLLFAMRKLREGIVASNRADAFALQAYSFCIRFGILTKHMESYHPALLHLLQTLHPKIPATKAERQEFSSYLILDLACRQADYAGAFSARRAYRIVCSTVDAVLHALVHGQSHLFWKTKRTANVYQAKLMEYAEERVRALAVKCLERVYFTIDPTFLTFMTGMEWEDFRGKYHVPWEQDGHTLVIRRRNMRQRPAEP